MKIINKLELTKEELETLEKAKQIIQNLNSYTELSLVLVFTTATILLKLAMETESGLSDILHAYEKHRSCMED